MACNRQNPRHREYLRGAIRAVLRRPGVLDPFEQAATGGNIMQYLPGWTVQCINPQCEARGHWMRAHLSGPGANMDHCPNCGDLLRTVPPPLGPRLRMRPRPLTARPLRPRPR